MKFHRARHLDQKGTAIVGLAIIVPVTILLIFTAYRLGVETAFRASIEHKQQTLLNAQVQGSYSIAPSNIFGLYTKVMKTIAVKGARGFTLFELLVVISIINLGIGLLLNAPLVTNNINHALNSSGVFLGIEGSPSTVLTSVWEVKCNSALAAPDLSSTVNPRFRKGEFKTRNDPGSVTALSAAQRDARYLDHGVKCAEMFTDTEVNKMLCNSQFSKYVCISVTTRAQNSLLGIQDVTQYRYKADFADTRCIQSVTAGAALGVIDIELNP